MDLDLFHTNLKEMLVFATEQERLDKLDSNDPTWTHVRYLLALLQNWTPDETLDSAIEKVVNRGR